MNVNAKLSPEAVLILVSLAGGPKHGYAIQQDVERVSGRRLGPGSLYGAIARLEAGNLVEALELRGPRRPYRLSASGSRVLANELEQLQRLTTAGKRRLAAR